MELSVDVHNLLEQVKVLKKRSEEPTHNGEVALKSHYEINVTDSLIDIQKVQFLNDETWLHEATLCTSPPVKDLHGWLYEDNKTQKNEKFVSENLKLSNEIAKIEAEKNFDSRTFTRPKKRFTRPSIEKYNKDLYGSDSENVSPTLSSPKKFFDNVHMTSKENNGHTPIKPLAFDLTQPTTSFYFENLANAPEVDSFQNMSPPSLVNSMCSSTFTNLMESSFINNDPALREIRDTDFTETVLLQDSEPPLFHSFTESCSSLNSDTPENFLRKLSVTGSFRKNIMRDFHTPESEKSGNNTFNKNSTFTAENDIGENEETEIIPKINKTLTGGNVEYSQESENKQTTSVVNGTYKRPSKYATYRKSDNRSNSKLDTTFQLSSKSHPADTTITYDKNRTQSPLSDVTSNINSTMIIESPKLKRRFMKTQQAQKEDSIEEMKQLLNGTQVITEGNHDRTDLNRLSYCDKSNEKLNCTINNDRNISANLKGSSLECSTGSADSLDRMSSLSGSSKGSSRMMNMAEVDALVEMQERSLQIMSTPKAHTIKKKLWEHNISPIVISEKEHFSDSDLSSNDDFKSARSSISKGSLENGIKATKSIPYIPENPRAMQKPRSINTVSSGTRNLQSMANAFRGSYTNLRSVGTQHNSQSNLLKMGSNLRGSQTNLKTVGPTLRGSYTSLRPISAVLPVAPPLKKSSSGTRDVITTHVIVDTHRKVAEVRPYVGSAEPCDTTFVKPQPPRSSGLPRPVSTGIPRPSSRIPGPRTLRPSSSHQGRQTNDNY